MEKLSTSVLDRIPLFIGITGHRDLHPDAIAGVKRELSTYLGTLRGQAPDTPLIFVSGLAEGADRLGAEMALDCGFSLWALLPTGIDEYEKDFNDVASRDAFRSLLDRAERVVNSSILAGQSENYSSRPEVYSNLKEQLCRICHILIGVWDGKVDLKLGGTSDVLSTFTSGSNPAATCNLITLPLCGSVLHINTPRQGQVYRAVTSSILTPAPFGIQKLHPRIIFPDYDLGFQQIAKKIDDFNRILSLVTVANTDFSERFVRVEENQDPLLRYYEFLFSSTEAISSSAWSEKLSAMLIIMVGFLSFTLLSLTYGGIVIHGWPLLLGLGCLGLASVVSLKIKSKAVENNYIAARCVAEILRVAIVWRDCNLKVDTAPIVVSEGIYPDDTLGLVSRSLDAIRLGFDGSGLEGKRAHKSSLGRARNWITEQQDYFSDRFDKIEFHALKAKKYTAISWISLFIAMLSYLLTIGLELFTYGSVRESAVVLTPWSMFLFWTMLSVSALSTGYSQLMGHQEHEEDYKSALIKFRIASARLKMDGKGKIFAVCKDLGTAAIQEVVRWAVTKRRKPIRLPF